MRTTLNGRRLRDDNRTVALRMGLGRHNVVAGNRNRDQVWPSSVGERLATGGDGLFYEAGRIETSPKGTA